MLDIEDIYRAQIEKLYIEKDIEDRYLQKIGIEDRYKRQIQKIDIEDKYRKQIYKIDI